jgi:hypothetical protein
VPGTPSNALASLKVITQNNVPVNFEGPQRSLHEGASAFAVGCYRVIRNPAAHIPLGELSEVEALEQIAAFSVLARWVDAATLDESL